MNIKKIIKEEINDYYKYSAERQPEKNQFTGKDYSYNTGLKDKKILQIIKDSLKIDMNDLHISVIDRVAENIYFELKQSGVFK